MPPRDRIEQSQFPDLREAVNVPEVVPPPKPAWKTNAAALTAGSRALLFASACRIAHLKPIRSLERRWAGLGWVGLGWVALLLLAHASDNIDSVTDNAFQPQ